MGELAEDMRFEEDFFNEKLSMVDYYYDKGNYKRIKTKQELRDFILKESEDR